MGIRMKVYGALVNRVPQIREKYHSVRDCQTRPAQRISAWLYLIGLNIAWLLGKRDFGLPNRCFPDREKKLPKGSESELSLRESPREMAERLRAYDVISFDVFDTLIFRPFETPQDLFFLVGERLNYPDFKRIRMETEQRAREECAESRGHREVGLADIYRCMERDAGVPAAKGMELEVQTEFGLCFANPYMKEVVGCLKAEGKKLIAVSDMYLSKDIVKGILKKCGYPDDLDCHVSCEYGKSKSDGSLFEQIKSLYGYEKSFVHVGDNVRSDVENAKKAGFDAVWYRNVNEAGKPCRTEDMSAVTGSVYRGIVNARIHNGLCAYGRDYEFGFIYGGIFALGYCQFIHEYAEQHDIDKLLFFSRDGDILIQVYRLLYPGERQAEYVPWSRLAATKMAAGYYKYDYYRRFLYHKVNQGISLERIFHTMELDDMLEDLEKQGLSKKQSLTDRNVETVRAYLNGRWTEVLSHYESQLEKGRLYYRKVLEGCRRVAAVDIGWAGSGAVTFSHIVNEIWKIPCEVTGIVAGSNSAHNSEPDMSEAHFYGKRLVSWMFSQQLNRDLWKRHDPARGDNVVFERLLSSPKPGFKGFTDTPYGACEAKKESLEIQAGILDFVRSYTEHAPGGAESIISGRDAAAPVCLWIDCHEEEMKKMDTQCVLQ